jgi:1,4-alpha-glucan branching enzyme
VLAKDAVAAIVRGDHGDPFSVLGMHPSDVRGDLVVRTFAPHASRVDLLDAATGGVVAQLERIDESGFFAGTIRERAPFAYRLRMTIGDAIVDVDDPYRFGPVLGELDVHLIGEGTHLRLYEKFGAHPATMDGVAGVSFVVWAPNAKRVSVVGSFNAWDGRRNPMRYRSGIGVWELFVPAVPLGATYKYELLGPDGNLLPLKADPCARRRRALGRRRLARASPGGKRA